VAFFADQVKVPRVAVRWFEPRAALPEVDFAGQAAVDHPLKSAVDRRTPDAGVLAAHHSKKIVGAQVPFLFEEGTQNLFALGRSFAACRTQARKVGNGSRHFDLVTW
jgi:hypothetical protein